MRVQVERDADRRVTEHLGHDLRMDALIEKKRRCGVAQCNRTLGSPAFSHT
jgi:hypothetical protein